MSTSSLQVGVLLPTRGVLFAESGLDVIRMRNRYEDLDTPELTVTAWCHSSPYSPPPRRFATA